MKSYNNFDEIEHDLKRLNLERQIALEKLKGIQYTIKEDLQPPNWLNLLFSIAKKYGAYYFIRKVLK